MMGLHSSTTFTKLPGLRVCLARGTEKRIWQDPRKRESERFYLKWLKQVTPAALGMVEMA
jgi:hypothetical protein